MSFCVNVNFEKGLTWHFFPDIFKHYKEKVEEKVILYKAESNIKKKLYISKEEENVVS